MRRMSKTLALISGLTLTLTGLIAFVPNPLVAQEHCRPVRPNPDGLRGLGIGLSRHRHPYRSASHGPERHPIRRALGLLFIDFGMMNTTRKQLLH